MVAFAQRLLPILFLSPAASHSGAAGRGEQPLRYAG